MYLIKWLSVDIHKWHKCVILFSIFKIKNGCDRLFTFHTWTGFFQILDTKNMSLFNYSQCLLLSNSYLWPRTHTGCAIGIICYVLNDETHPELTLHVEFLSITFLPVLENVRACCLVHLSSSFSSSLQLWIVPFISMCCRNPACLLTWIKVTVRDGRNEVGPPWYLLTFRCW